MCMRESGVSPKALTEPPRATQGPFIAITVGACCGGLLFVLGGLKFFIEAVAQFKVTFGSLGRYLSCGNSIWPEVLDCLLLPALLGGVAGSATGCAVWIARTRRHMPFPALILSWGLLGGVILVLLPTGAIVFCASVFGSVGHDDSGGGGVFLLMLLCELLAFAIGSLVGAIVGVMIVRRRNS
jgi:hypothetical protein